MFQLNPLELPGAWWQHLLMLLVPGVIGYIIGYRSKSLIISDLDERLTGVDIDLEACVQGRNKLATRIVGETAPDDLKVIEGIGPQIENLLYKAGIQTYGQLSGLSPEKIKEILVAADPRFQVHEPATWPRQAAMAAEGKWQQLKDWQDVLDAGRE